MAEYRMTGMGQIHHPAGGWLSGDGESVCRELNRLSTALAESNARWASLSKGPGVDIASLDGITPGEWAAKNWRVCANVNDPVNFKHICDTANNHRTRNHENHVNARAIAAVPKLIQEVNRLRAAEAELRGALNKIIEDARMASVSAMMESDDAAAGHNQSGDAERWDAIAKAKEECATIARSALAGGTTP